jgi:hypothetical protein
MAKASQDDEDGIQNPRFMQARQNKMIGNVLNIPLMDRN